MNISYIFRVGWGYKPIYTWRSLPNPCLYHRNLNAISMVIYNHQQQQHHPGHEHAKQVDGTSVPGGNIILVSDQHHETINLPSINSTKQPATVEALKSQQTGWWFGTFYMIFHSGMSSSQLTFTHIFFRGVGLNHQPDKYIYIYISIKITKKSGTPKVQ